MEQSQARPELIGRHPEQEPSCRLHRRVAYGYGLLAVSAPPAEQHIGDEGQVVRRPDGLTTIRAVRGWPHDRLAVRNTVNHHVQEAADDEPEEDGHEDYQA